MIERQSVAPGRLFLAMGGGWGLIPVVLVVLVLMIPAAPPAPPGPVVEEVVERVPLELTIVAMQVLPPSPYDGAAHMVTYTWRDADGVLQTDTEEVSPDIYAGLQVGSRVHTSVEQTRSRTVLPETQDTGGDTPLRVMQAIMGLAGLAGAACVLTVGRGVLSAIRAARDGEIREARVTAHHDANFHVNRVGMFRAEWTDATGQSGRSRLRAQAALPPPGSVIVVCADPRTGRTWWTGDI